jgi:hypothetical protein
MPEKIARTNAMSDFQISSLTVIVFSVSPEFPHHFFSHLHDGGSGSVATVGWQYKRRSCAQTFHGQIFR